jgi:hypothetical protein
VSRAHNAISITSLEKGEEGEGEEGEEGRRRAGKEKSREGEEGRRRRGGKMHTCKVPHLHKKKKYLQETNQGIKADRTLFGMRARCGEKEIAFCRELRIFLFRIHISLAFNLFIFHFISYAVNLYMRCYPFQFI